MRHYFLRQGSNVGDIQVNLVGKGDRKQQSHAIAKRVREAIAPIGELFGARIKVAEVPRDPRCYKPSWPKMSGPNYERQIEIAGDVRARFKQTAGIVDVDWYMEDLAPKERFVIDQEKAAISGVSEAEVVRALRLLSAGEPDGLLHDEREKGDVPILLRLDRASRSDPARMLSVRLTGRDGNLVSMGELVHRERATLDRSIYHKNLMPVVYVTADVAGVIESPVYAILKLGPELSHMMLKEGYAMTQYTATRVRM